MGTAEKKRALALLLAAARWVKGLTVLFEDETTVQLAPTLLRQWGVRGQQPTVPTWPGGHRRVHCFGALHVRTGRFHRRFAPRMTAAVFAAFLRQLLRRYRRGWVVVIVDNAGWHRGPAIRAVTEAHPRLGLFFLPRYCPRWNPVDWVWKELRRTASHNVFFGALDCLQAALGHALTRLTHDHAWGRRLIRKAGYAIC